MSEYTYPKKYSRLIFGFPFVLGLISTSSQILLLRLFFSLFSGIELTSGIFLSFWLFWIGTGGIIFFLISGRLRCKLRWLLSLGTLLPLAVLFSYVFPVLLRMWLSIGIGEILGVDKIVFTSFWSVSMLGLTLGFSFGLSCFMLPLVSKETKISFSYILESLGSFSGGIFFGYILVALFSGLELVLSICLLSAVYFLVLCIVFSRKSIFWINLGLILFLIYLLSAEAKGKLSIKLFSHLVKGYTLEEIKDSFYLNTWIIRRSGELGYIEDGVLSFSVPNKEYAEYAVHLNLLQHPHPKDILLISTSGGNLLGEISQYPQAKVDCIELDFEKLKLLKKYLEEDFYRHYEKADIITGDVYYRLKDLKKYDSVIMNLSSPLNLLLNRFYTREFFKEVKSHLRSPGVFSFSISGSQDYWSPQLLKLVKVLKNTLDEVFEDSFVYPLGNMIFVAANKKDLILKDYREILKKLSKKHIKTVYFREYYLFDKLSALRLEQFYNSLGLLKIKDTNTLMHPLGFWLELVRWSGNFRGLWVRAYKGLKPALLRFIMAGILTVIFLVVMHFRPRRVILFSLSLGGFSQIIFQILNVFFFQILYGYVYYMMGAIFSAFMLGLSVGAFWAIRRFKMNYFRGYIRTQFFVAIYPLVLICLVLILKNSNFSFVDFLGRSVVFLVMPLSAGLCAGLQYVLANKIFLCSWDESIGSLTYGFDLLGSSLGALVMVAFILPILGFMESAFWVFIANFAMLLILRRRLPELCV